MEREARMSQVNAAPDHFSDDEPPVLVNVIGLEMNETLTDSAPPSAITVKDGDLPPCPVTILSGFLGAGKTTLIQCILQSPDHGKRIAVIENEFGGGDDGLSVETMIARDGANEASLSDLIELPNGCICCTVKDSLVTTLENLLEKRQDLDYILIEASGMANPGPIASLFWLDDALESRLRLDGVVTLVDAYNIVRQLKDTEEAAQQIAYADRILLNKADLVDQEQLREAIGTIRDIHPTAPIRHTTYSKVPDLDWILDAACFDVNRAKELDMVLSQMQQPTHENEAQHSYGECSEPSCQQCAAAGKSHSHPTCSDPTCQQCSDDLIESLGIPSRGHVHTSAVSTIALVRDGSVDLRRMNRWLASILWPNQDEKDIILRARLEQDDEPSNQEGYHPDETMRIFRVKGILSVRHEEDDVAPEDHQFVDHAGLDIRRYVVQAVHDLWEIHPASADLHWDQALPGETNVPSRSCKLVVIGRHLREEVLRSGFEACCVA
jgi:G3E family GTPase